MKPRHVANVPHSSEPPGGSRRGPPMSTVLFLCTGNYYRSRFAEVHFNALAAAAGHLWRADSRALAIERGFRNVGPMAPHALERLTELGHLDDTCSRFPQAAAEEDFKRAKVIIALLEEEHRPLLEERHPAWVDQVVYWQVQDRPGILPEIEREVVRLLASLPQN